VPSIIGRNVIGMLPVLRYPIRDKMNRATAQQAIDKCCPFVTFARP
jgi:hypothetical protein